MKLVWVVFGLTVALVGFSVACGPKEKYCLDVHESCTQALEDYQKAQRDKEAGTLDADMTDAGSIILD